MIFFVAILSTNTPLGQVDPMTFLFVPLMAYAADVNVVKAIGASLSDFGKRLHSFLGIVLVRSVRNA